MTYRPRIARPQLLVRDRAQTIRLEVWDDLALIEPTAGTVTVYDGNGDVVTTGAATITARVATLAISAATLPTTLALSDAWRITWELTIDGAAQRFDQMAALVRAGWLETVTPGDLIARHQELAAGRELDPQQEGGATTLGGFIEEASTELFTRLWTDGKRPWLILDTWTTRRFVIPQALALAFRWASTFSEQTSRLAATADTYDEAASKAYDVLQFRYDAAETGSVADAVRISAADMAILGAGRRP